MEDDDSGFAVLAISLALAAAGAITPIVGLVTPGWVTAAVGVLSVGISLYLAVRYGRRWVAAVERLDRRVNRRRTGTERAAGRSPHRPVWVAGAAGILILAIGATLGAGATVLVLSKRHLGTGHMPVAQAAITFPHNYVTNVPPACTLKAAGTAQHIQSNHHLWLFLYFYDDEYYAGNNLHLGRDGRWSGHIYIGGAKTSGQQFALWVFDLGPKGWRMLNTDINGQENGFHGWRLANDVTRLAYVTFITGHEKCQTTPAA